ncbi:hypothetical protein Cgig2_008820 [Carnegiea gigantea]|uniref:Uncharacterized protein n=1 Tax=Carnegiea gigantea TaxID=171969 RepID=A0A9Q1GME9_9CARY|nr:hypothetical protein Cgig2_008820 [Carnegiea gigantea]
MELPSEDAENNMDILDAKPNLIECMGESDNVDFKEELAHGSQCFPSIGRIPSFGKDLFDSGSRLDGLQDPPQRGVSFFNDNVVTKEVDKNAAKVFGQSILDKMSRTSFNGHPSLQGDFDSLRAIIFQKCVDATLLQNRVEGLIKQACNFKDLIESYSG